MHIHHGLSNLPAFRNAVITIGSFDGVHRGHVQLIKRIKDLAESIEGESIVLFFDPHPRSIVYPNDDTLRLLTTVEEKLAQFERHDVDHVVIVPFSVEFSQQHPEEYIEKFLLKSFQPKYIVIGYDHRFGLNRQGDISLLRRYEKSHGFEVIEVSKQEEEDIAISSTNIRKSIVSGSMLDANLLLGYRYGLTGSVVKGDQIGSSIGFPTANVKPANRYKLIPGDGIYAVLVTIEDVLFKGMLYIGNRPSVDKGHKKVIEVHIFDFSGNLYDQDLTLYFVDYIRDDQKFASLDELKSQLSKDEKAAKQILSYHLDNNEKSIATLAILNYNGLEHLESYLPSMLYSSSRDIDYLLIDNYSTDDSVAYVAEYHPEFKIKSLKQNYGFAGGYNRGLIEVKSEYLVIINSDVLVTEGWLDPILDLMEQDQTIGAVQPKILSLEQKNTFEYAGAAGGFIDKFGYPFCRGRIMDTCEQDSGQYDQTIEIAWTSGACMVVRRQLFMGIGAFDATYFAHHEEIDLCYRIKAAGYRMVCHPKSSVYHLGGGTLSYESPRKTYLNFKNNIQTLVKNEPKSSLFGLLLMRLMIDTLASWQMILTGKWRNGLMVWKAYLHNLAQRKDISRRRSYYKNLIKNHRIASGHRTGHWSGVLIIDYFLRGKRKFSSLNIQTKPYANE